MFVQFVQRRTTGIKLACNRNYRVLMYRTTLTGFNYGILVNKQEGLLHEGYLSYKLTGNLCSQLWTSEGIIVVEDLKKYIGRWYLWIDSDLIKKICEHCCS
jgi:hypothetical protein